MKKDKEVEEKQETNKELKINRISTTLILQYNCVCVNQIRWDVQRQRIQRDQVIQSHWAIK